MHYIIDGHNLIPHVRGLSLSDPEDETKLLELLNRFQRVRRANITVYFDRAPLGQNGTRRYGSIKAVFMQTGKTADLAIMEALAKNKTAAKSITLVSSDRQVIAAGRERHTKVLSSAQFAQEIEIALTETSSPERQDLSMSSGEVEEWLNLFNQPPKGD